MNERLSQLTEIDSFIQKVDAEVTLVLQTLQWDRQQILKGCEMVPCNYDKGHSIPARGKAEHEEKCFLRSQSYSSEDKLLPDPPNPSNVVRFDEMEIRQIIENAARTNPQFRRGPGIVGPVQPLSVDRLQSSFSYDERRAIHDAVVAAAPTLDYHELDLKMPSAADKGTPPAGRAKSHAEVLAELRDMKRRRTKYRLGAKTKHYSDALRDVIQTQMELYSEITTTIKTEPDTDEPTNTTESNSNIDNNKQSERDRYRDPAPTSHTIRPKHQDKERDRSIARYSGTGRDARYSKEKEYKSRDKSYSRNSHLERDRNIKKERNEREGERTFNTDKYSNEGFNVRDMSKSRSKSRQYEKEKSREYKRDTRYAEGRSQREGSKSKYNDRERMEKHNKYSSSSKYQNYNKHEEYNERSKDKERSRQRDKYGS